MQRLCRSGCSLLLLVVVVNGLVSPGHESKVMVHPGPSRSSETGKRLPGSMTLRGGSHFDALNMLSSAGLHRDLAGLFRRKEYEFCKEDEKIFNATCVVMRHVSKGFALHGMFEFVAACKSTYEDGLMGVRRFTGCLDEIAYSIFIHYAASAFEKICSTKGSDMENLMEAIEAQRKLWVKMRIPLIIRTIVLAIQMIKYLVGLRHKM